MNRRGLALSLLLGACSSPPPVRTEADPALEAREVELREQNKKRTRFELVLLQLDKTIDKWAEAMSRRGEPRADRHIEQLEKSIHDLVVDEQPRRVRPGEAQPPPGENYRRLLATAADASVPANQGIALAALGFAKTPEVMPVLLAGVQMQDPYIVDKAVLGLAVLQAPRTPPRVLLPIIANPQHPLDGRVGAAWALYRLQQTSEFGAEIAQVWVELLTEHRDGLPAGCVVQALRGLGLARDKANADLCASFADHPLPLVRMTVATSLARMNAQAHWEVLVRMLEPGETNQNVRLFAKQALTELAGGVDRGYDAARWREHFQRGAER